MKQRSELKRKKPMGGAAPAREKTSAVRQRIAALLRAPEVQRGVMGGRQQVNSRPKDKPLQHSGYMALVRKLQCAHCGWPAPSQFCHSDYGGKGTGLKTDCRQGYPGCGPHLEGEAVVPGCHWRIGTSGSTPKQDRRELELRLGAQTRETIIRNGDWPPSLPLWEKEQS